MVWFDYLTINFIHKSLFITTFTELLFQVFVPLEWTCGVEAWQQHVDRGHQYFAFQIFTYILL